MVTADSEISVPLPPVPNDAPPGEDATDSSPVLHSTLPDLIHRARQGRLSDAERHELDRQVEQEHDARMAKIRSHLILSEPPGDKLPIALQREVRERAHLRCEYCRIHEEDTGSADAASGCMADLIVTEKHGGQVTSENLAYFCLTCNRSRGNALTSYAHDGTDTHLFNPRQDSWDEHFRVEGYLIIPLTPIAEATNHAFDFNAPPRRDERRGLQLLGRYPVEAEIADNIA